MLEQLDEAPIWGFTVTDVNKYYKGVINGVIYYVVCSEPFTLCGKENIFVRYYLTDKTIEKNIMLPHPYDIPLNSCPYFARQSYSVETDLRLRLIKSSTLTL